jgi:hypothetical protein
METIIEENKENKNIMTKEAITSNTNMSEG